MELSEALGIVLKDNRTKLELSQEEFAHRCNIDRTYISLLERGKRKPTLHVIFQISKNLNLETNEFVKQIETLINQ